MADWPFAFSGSVLRSSPAGMSANAQSIFKIQLQRSHPMQQPTTLPLGKHLFLKFLNRSRTGLSVTVAVLVRNPDAQPGQQMINVSQFAASRIEAAFNPIKDGVVLRFPNPEFIADDIARVLAGKLGKKLHSNEQAFTWEWL